MNYGAHAFDMDVKLAPFGPFMSGSSAKLRLLGHAPAINLVLTVGRIGMPIRFCVAA